MPKIDLSQVPVKTGSSYPAPFDAEMGGRSSRRLAEFAGLTQFGANLVTLAPRGKSSMRHYHMKEDEFLIITEGTCTLVEDGGETLMHVGDCAAFKAGVENGHVLVNNTEQPAKFLVIGTDDPNETAVYSDIDMKVVSTNGDAVFMHKDGTPY